MSLFICYSGIFLPCFREEEDTYNSGRHLRVDIPVSLGDRGEAADVWIYVPIFAEALVAVKVVVDGSIRLIFVPCCRWLDSDKFRANSSHGADGPRYKLWSPSGFAVKALQSLLRVIKDLFGSKFWQTFS